MQLYLKKISWSEIAIPSVVVAEVLRGWCDFALKATPVNASFAHRRLLEEQQFLSGFRVVLFDEPCAHQLTELLRKHKAHKLYADMMIAAVAIAGKHILVTRNQKDFVNLLPKNQLANWIDDKPSY